MESAELVTRLQVIQDVQGAIKTGVGTNVVEAEMWRMVLERVAGPTGHCMLRDVRLYKLVNSHLAHPI